MRVTMTAAARAGARGLVACSLAATLVSTSPARAAETAEDAAQAAAASWLKLVDVGDYEES